MLGCQHRIAGTCTQAVEVLYMHDRVLFVERSGELRWLARVRAEGLEPKGNRV